MRAWYDIRSFTPEGRADAAGLADSVQWVNRYLDSEIARGVAAERIVHARFPKVGAMALSAYRPFPAQLAMEKSHANSGLPILMCHGRMDPVVNHAKGTEARDAL